MKIEGQVGGDIVLHLLVATLLGISACWAGRDPKLLSRATKNQWILRKKQFALIGLSAVLISLDESMQYFVPTRTFSIHDWLANMFGLFNGVLIYLFVCICRSHYSRG
nr:VanZ family protein [Vibrio lentus]